TSLDIIDNLDKVKPVEPVPVKDAEEIKRAKSKQNLLLTILVPLGVGIVLIGGIIGWFIKVRYLNKKVK
ncbi:hypothetical protein KQ878_03685, partial [Mycoplasma zalophidermidis]